MKLGVSVRTVHRDSGGGGDGAAVPGPGRPRTRVTATDTRTVANQQVHNLTVDDLHTYYVEVGDAEILVHNQDPGCVNDYSGHARQRMSQRGISEDMVKQTVANGKTSKGNSPGTTKYKSGKLWVILNNDGKVVSVGRN